MSIDVVCEGCSKKYRLPDDKAGATIRCKECGEKIRVPAADDFADADSRPVRRKGTAAGKKKKKSGSSLGLMIGLGAGGAAIVLLLVGFVVWRMMAPGQGPGPVANSGNQPPGMQNAAPPAAQIVWSVVADPPQNSVTWPAAPPKLDGFRGQLSQLKFPSAQSPFVVSGVTGSSDYMRVWNLATGEVVGQFDQPKPQFSGSKTALSADGTLIAVVQSGKQEAEIWPVREAKLNKSIPTGKAGATIDYVDVVAPDRLFIVDHDASSGKNVHRLAAFDIPSGKPLYEIVMPDAIYYEKVAMSPGLRYLAIDHGYSEGLRIYDLTKGVVAGRVPPGEYSGPGVASSGLRFSKDGSKLGILGSSSEKTFVAVVDLATGKSTRTGSMPGTINSVAPSYIYTNAPQLQWLDDGQGWLIGGNVILDAASNSAVWRVQTEANEYQLENARARISVGSNVWSVNGPDSDGVLTQIEIPWDKIRGLLAKLDDELNILKAGATVGVAVNVGMLRFAEAEPTKQELIKGLQTRLASLGLKAGDDAAVVFRAAYAEEPGNTLEFGGIGQVAGRKSVQSTKTLLDLKLTDASGSTVYWSRKDEQNPFSMLMQTDPTPELVRKECFKQVLGRVSMLVLPTYLNAAADEQLPVLHPLPRW